MTLHNMDTSFNLENFISNLASLARQPFDPEALPDLLEQVTGHRWERSASASTSAASASASVPSAPSASTPHLAAAVVAIWAKFDYQAPDIDRDMQLLPKYTHA